MEELENVETIEQEEVIEEIKSYRVRILDEIGYVLDENGIEVSKEDLNSIGTTKCFDVENNCVIDYDNTKDTAIRAKQERISELKSLLYATDYKAIKYAEGELSYSDYEETRLLRKSYRDEINKLEQEIRELK